MSALLKIETSLAPINCGRCGGVYAINERYRASCEEHGRTWNCPYCQCGWGYRESLADRDKKRIAELTAKLVNEQKAKERALARVNEANASLERTKARIKNGVCPCCNRTFVRLGTHMTRMHPEYSQ